MCGRYVLVQSIEVIEKRFNVTLPIHFDWTPSYNIGPGNVAPVITSENPQKLQLFTFGLTPFWAKKQMYLFNARAEGDRNPENLSNYNGSKDIINKPAFRKSIRGQRCLVIADAFIEGSTAEGLSKPYLVFLRSRKRPFAFAGIYDQWINESSGEVVNSFAIITTAANETMNKIQHHRCPLILDSNQESKWLSMKTPLTDITNILKPNDSELLNAFPISPEIKNIKNNGKSFIQAIGETIYPDFEISTKKTLKLQGMGNQRKLNNDIVDSIQNPTII